MNETNLEKKVIEFACTGNNGRSPMAAAIAQNYILEMGYDNEFSAISSGTFVDGILVGDYAIGLKKKIIDGVIQNNLLEVIYKDEKDAVNEFYKEVKDFTADELEKRCSEDSDFRSTFEKYVETGRKYFANEENKHCIAVAKEESIDIFLDGNFKQTKPRIETVAFLAMGESNLNAAEKIYQEAGIEAPYVMDVITRYVELEGEVPNTFAQSETAYKDMTTSLKEIVPKAVDKVIMQYIGQ